MKVRSSTAHSTMRPLRAFASTVLATLLLATACGPATPSATPSASSGATAAVVTPPAATNAAASATPATASPAPPAAGLWPGPAVPPRGDLPEITCSGSIGPSDPLAIVHVRGSGSRDLVLRDYADIANPRTVCEGFDYRASFLDARHLLAGFDCTEIDCAVAVIDLPEVSIHWYLLPFGPGQNKVFQLMSPDQRAIAWLHNDDSGGRTLHITDSSGDSAVAFFPLSQGRCGSELDSNTAAFSHSGRYFFELDQVFPETNTLVVAGGHDMVFSLVPPDGGWTDDKILLMPVWSPVSDTMFYRRGNNVFQWTPQGGQKRVLQGVAWLNPSFTPDGRHVAWAVATANSHDVYLAETANLGGARLIGKNRRDPVFLNNRQLWYRSDVPSGCVGLEEPKNLVFNIRTGTEASSIVDEVGTIWPGTSSNH